MRLLFIFLKTFSVVFHVIIFVIVGMDSKADEQPLLVSWAFSMTALTSWTTSACVMSKLLGIELIGVECEGNLLKSV